MNRGTGTFFLFVIMLITALFIGPEMGTPDGVVYSALTPDSPDSRSAAPRLTFAGKVSDTAAEKWLNDYLVLLYLDGVEIGRTHSQRNRYTPAGSGVYDGTFVITIDNAYALTAADDFRYANGNQPEWQTARSPSGFPAELFVWYPSLTPGRIIRIAVPDKRIEYALVLLAQPAADLPAAIRQETTTLNGDGYIQAALPPPTAKANPLTELQQELQ